MTAGVYSSLLEASSSSANSVSFSQLSWESRLDVFTVICVEHGGLDKRWVLLRVVADEHPLFQISVFSMRPLRIGIYFTNILILSVGYPLLWMFSSAGVAPLPPGFHKLLERDSHDLCRFFPPGRTFSMVRTCACCPCHSSTCDLHISCWQGGDICQAIAAEAFTLLQLRTVVFFLNPR